MTTTDPSWVPHGARRDPIQTIRWVHVDDLSANHYNPNRVFKLELALLQRSLLSTGWIQPVLANTNNVIIDGFHRWMLSRDDEQMQQRYRGFVPTAFLDVSDDMAMAITVRINRAKGSHAAVEMSELVHSLVKDYGWSRERIGEEIGAHPDEVALLLTDDVFARKKVYHWAYSEAWYPKPSGQADTKSEATFGGYGNLAVTDLDEATRTGIVPSDG